ncbi:LCP family protein [Actinophytocola sp.]|uniref:LCP family protein n=1 Tax=Actinophytocola sp. TaxID=1872138 RepID=UPI002D3D0863|nr:LCP family protein [Actinophytocola sp.]HYQ68689.1 LCP family protein [Actinophytocola sp.]
MTPPEQEEGAAPDGLMDELADAAPAPSRRRLWRRALAITAGMLCSLVLVAVGGLYVLSDRLMGNIERIPSVFASLDPDQRPARPAGQASQGTTFLLAGSDSLAGEPTTGTSGEDRLFQPGAQRSDAIMLVRLNTTHPEATVVSIPRDSWVPVPGHGTTKINAAYAYGGPTLLVQTIERLTGVRVDHFATIDFAGFRAIVDAVDGIDVTVAARTTFGPVVFTPGINHLDGRRALAYVRQRKGLPRGDLDRVQRQQSALRALMDKTVSSGLLGDPAQLYQLLSAVTRFVGVDDTLSDDDLLSLAANMRSLRPSDVTFMTAPVTGTGYEGDQSVVYLDKVRAPLLWDAVEHDTVHGYLALNGGDTLGGSPR